MVQFCKDTIASLSDTELRLIQMPDGSRRPFINPKWLWLEHDFIVDHFTDSKDRAAWIVRLAHEDAEQSGRSFGKLYPVLIQYIANAIRTGSAEDLGNTHGRA